ncbi:MAG TPA: hypothetical protein DCM05_13235 [Elusimicrobia bacterium]|nr:hypothetical protein [Elusimicrobiota bacterium]
MLRAAPFKGVRFDPSQDLGRALCPPYDVIAPPLARELRAFPENAVHVELPAGTAGARYRNAAAAWKRWRRQGLLVQDGEPSYYVSEQRTVAEGRDLRRLGLYAELGVDDESMAGVLAHERTLAKPKEDRLRLLETLRVNTSPVFAIFPDEDGGVRAALFAAQRRQPLWAGRDLQGSEHRLWRVQGTLARGLERLLREKTLLIADGHHRCAVAREHFKAEGAPESAGTLAYLCPEEDPGLLVLPTHRVLEPTEALRANLGRARLRETADLQALCSALDAEPSPYAFGLFDGRFRLGVPLEGDPGVPSAFGTQWLSERILEGADPQKIVYVHDAAWAVEAALRRRSWAFLLKRFAVADIRRAVQRAGLLPQKSTYFIPKAPAGLVFRALDPL